MACPRVTGGGFGGWGDRGGCECRQLFPSGKRLGGGGRGGGGGGGGGACESRQLFSSAMVHRTAACAAQKVNQGCLQELQACPTCKGQNWSQPSHTPPSYTQADLADPPASHFWSPESLNTGSPPDAASSASAAASSQASTPDLQPATVKGTPRRGSRSGPKTQVDCLSCQHLWQKWSSLADWHTLPVFFLFIHSSSSSSASLSRPLVFSFFFF